MNFKPKTRKYIYGVIAALVPLLVAIGSLSEELATHVLGVFAALLTIGGSALAIRNVPEDDE